VTHVDSLESFPLPGAALSPKAGVSAINGPTSLPYGVIQVFLYLQVLDLLTTLVGFKVGAAEASPFVRVLMHAGPAQGVVLSKIVGLALGGICVYTRKYRLIRWVNYWCSALVVWNLIIILLATGRI
jgi:hypothetical protein